MSKENHHKRRDVIAEEAASYLVELESPQPDTKAKLAAWLKTSPEHVEEFLAAAELWGALPDVAQQPSIDELVALAAGEDNVIDLAAIAESNDASVGVHGSRAAESSQPANPPVAAPTHRLRNWSLGLAAAAAIATIAIVGSLQFLPPPIDPNVHTTAIGEQTSLPLPDGSMVTINTQSTLRVVYSSQYRDIHLASGEALFDVTNDPDRPFRVITEHAVVTAVGTQFNVRNVADDVVVTVVEGIVDVEATERDNNAAGHVGVAPEASELAGRQREVRQPARLTVGQQARIASGELAVFETAIDKATAWRERRLVFESLTLADVIDEFNRYNDPPLLIEDAALRELPISGVFRANDRDSFVQFLKTMELAQSQTLVDGTIVLQGLDENE